jgi:hypothetical protein
MPLVFRIDHEARVIVVAGFGVLTDDEFFNHHRRLITLDETIGYDELIDLTHITRIALPSADRVRELAAEAAGSDERRGASKLAVVAPSDFAYALGRMFQTTRGLDARSTRDVGVFRSMEEGLEFLGIDHPLELPTLE